MKISKSNWLIGTAAIVLALCAFTFSAHANDSDEADIKALEASLVAAAQAKDVDAIMKNYVPGESLVVFDVIPPRQYSGADAYAKDWHAFLDGFAGPVTF